ncbi:MAG: hypothetical protein FWG73_06655 [Planctomycetaceae bacterium]|nr:hypothetical protein [Planctomycetaceae bacterium]
MKKKYRHIFPALAIALTVLTASALAQRPITPLRNIGDSIRNIGKTVEADPSKEYMLSETDGPFLIMAAVFSGPTARQEAHSLVLELRKTHKWNAFVYEKTFVFDANQDFQKAKNPFTGRSATQYRNRGGETEFAVLIGNFPSLDDRQFERTLADVRKCQPETLKGRRSPTPFSMAFGLANPMLPPEHQRGVVDAFIESINKGPYSLLRNPRHYTVQIATYTGQMEYKRASALTNSIPLFNPKKKTELEMAGEAAIALCKALRDRGIEAYEFHDRYASIVTVGSFDQPNHPMIQQIIQQYQARIDGNSLKTVVIDGIECDPKPIVIEVPRVKR